MRKLRELATEILVLGAQSRGSRRCWPARQSVSFWGTTSPGHQHTPALSKGGFQEQVFQFLTCDYEDPGQVPAPAVNKKLSSWKVETSGSAT